MIERTEQETALDLGNRWIWEHAKSHGFAIVSKDTDFRERSFVEGFPPKSGPSGGAEG
jgi:predicted nuclease of predicted toxin-antitoxin system